ncbi:hypothetical protein DdX_14615 [Ditylenchus destructor]|uniref:Uncharacterized protein n=1 Tax=Ditylenchus destructor TaxID=166010 RepID=A0AAD4MWR1_9BILA|nr:hypothetical protein DdX_14615 [Ditylenchus destructor]
MSNRNCGAVAINKHNADYTELTTYMEQNNLKEYWRPGQYVFCRDPKGYSEARISRVILYEDTPVYHVNFSGKKSIKVLHEHAINGGFMEFNEENIRQVAEEKNARKKVHGNTVTRSQRGSQSKKARRKSAKPNRNVAKPATNQEYGDYSNWEESTPLDELMSGIDLSCERSISPLLPISTPEKRNITIDEAEKALASGKYTPQGIWFGLLPNFSRKQLFKLQLSSRTVIEEVESLDLAAFHIIDNLHFKKGEQDDKDGIKMFSIRPSVYIPGAIWKQQIKDFLPPDYVRFSEVYFHTFVINADFMERLRMYKVNFTGCSFWMMPTDMNEDAGETLKFLMENIFTECNEIRLNLAAGWHSVDQLTFLAQSLVLPGVVRCNKITLSSDEMSLDEKSPLYAPIFQWLHSGAGNEKRIMSLRGFKGWPNLIYKLMLRFASDKEPHFYLLYVSDIELGSLGGRKYYYSYNTYTGEQLRLYKLEDEGGCMFCLTRMPSGHTARSLFVE